MLIVFLEPINCSKICVFTATAQTNKSLVLYLLLDITDESFEKVLYNQWFIWVQDLHRRNICTNICHMDTLQK